MHNILLFVTRNKIVQLV